MAEPTTEQLLQGILSNQDNNSNLTDWARRELEIAGLFQKDSDYDGMIGQAAYDLIRLFSMQGHSGFSAALVAEIVGKLMRWDAERDWQARRLREYLQGKRG